MLVTEWVLVATILVLGMMPAALSVRDRIHQAIARVGQAGDLESRSFCDWESAD
jgi:hypothetical protein